MTSYRNGNSNRKYFIPQEGPQTTRLRDKGHDGTGRRVESRLKVKLPMSRRLSSKMEGDESVEKKEGNSRGNEAKGGPQVLEMEQMAVRGGQNVGGRKGKHSLFIRTLPKSFSNSQPFSEGIPRDGNIFRFSIRPSSRQPSDDYPPSAPPSAHCHGHLHLRGGMRFCVRPPLTRPSVIPHLFLLRSRLTERQRSALDRAYSPLFFIRIV